VSPSSLVTSLLLFAGLACVAGGCADTKPILGGSSEELELVLVAPVTSGASPEFEAAWDALAAERYAEARSLYRRILSRDPDPAQEAELLFFAAHAELALGDYDDAYELYLRILSDHPTSERYATVVERVFLIGRLFCEGQATKPSLLLGISLADREFGVEILERFREARGRHALSDDALHYIAIARFDSREWELAIDAWETLREEYPTSELAEGAEFHIAFTFLTMSDGPEYDTQPLETGLLRMERYIQHYPTGSHVTQAQDLLAELAEDISAHKLGIARWYLRRDYDYSAHVYLTAIRREFGDRTEAGREAAELLASLGEVAYPPAPGEAPIETLDEVEDEDDAPLPPSSRPVELPVD
jgi:outer membrane protein assembly factor BamD (BamD/ComL family)